MFQVSNLLILKMNFKKTLLTTIVACGLWYPTYAQTLDKDTIEIEELSVNASVLRQRESSLKLLAPLKDIPLTTSSISLDQMEQRGIIDINDAMRYATGIRATVNYGGFQTFNMRGFGSPVIMLDGVRDERMNYSNSAPMTSLANIQSVEYLKGPASVLYGHSAVGGILNIIRKQPTTQSTTNASASYGSWNSKRMQVGNGGSLAPNLTYRFDIGLSDREGWRDNNDETANAYLALNYQLSENDKFSFRMGDNSDFYGTEAGLPSFTNDIYSVTNDEKQYDRGELHEDMSLGQRYNDVNDFMYHKSWNTSLNYEHVFSDDLRLVNMVAYTDDLIDYFSTEELSFLTSDDAIYEHYYTDGETKTYINIDSLQRTFPLRFAHDTKTVQNTLDLYINKETGNIEHKALVGYALQHIDRVSYTGYSLGSDVKGDGLYGTVAVVNPELNQGALETSFSRASIANEWVHGFYVQDLMSIGEKLNIMLGMRYDLFNYSKRTETVTDGWNYTNEGETQTITNKSFSYRGGLVYDLTKDLSVYASASSFFKPYRTTYNENYIYIDKDGKEFFPEDGGEVFQPEEGIQTEAGLKFSLTDKLQLSASAFYIKKENVKEYLAKVDDKNVYGQVGTIKSQGFDMEFIYRPITQMTWSAGYGYTDAFYAEYAANDYIDAGTYQGNTLSQVPKHHAYSWMNYTLDKGMFKNFSFGLGLDYTSEVFTNSANTYSLDAYTVVDATMAYNFGITTIRLNLNNVFDKEYFTSSVYSSQYIPAMPRNGMLSISIKI